MKKRRVEDLEWIEQVTVYQFPEDHDAKEMLRIFSLYGWATEVVIPSKRDKLGRRFGFVRFIDNIIIGATKIHVNLPRYSRDVSKQRGYPNLKMEAMMEDRKSKRSFGAVVEDRRGKRVLAQEVKDTHRSSAAAEGHQSRTKYSNQIFNQPLLAPWKPFIHEQRSREKSEVKHRGEARRRQLRFDVSNEVLELFRKMYVGFVKQPGNSYRVQDWYSMQGVFSIKATPIGATKVLLEDIEEGTLDDLVCEDNRWIYEWFEVVKPSLAAPHC